MSAGSPTAQQEATHDLRVCALDDIRPGEPLKVELAGLAPLAVYLVEGEVYVTDDTCTHGKASLGEEGELNGFLITCTWHDGVYDIRTGEPKQMPCTESLRIYPAIVRDGCVYIQTPR